MGFGGGAFIGSNLSYALMNAFKSPTSTGVAPTFATMGVIYFIFMVFGAWIVRVPAADWKPAHYTPPDGSQKLVTQANVALDQAWRTPQFWLLWAVLCLNVTAGIGILEQASPMIQEMFPAGPHGVPKGVGPAAATAFVALLSLFNMGGRFLWSSFSDFIGRKNVYIIYLLLGATLYGLIPSVAHSGRPLLFVMICAVLLSMYGGGFATIPAYLRDLFGSMQVGAIHGRLLTAWSVAGVMGPMLVNNLREYLKAHGANGPDRYIPTMYLMAGLLLVGLICNLLVRPVDARYHFHGDQNAPKPVPPTSPPRTGFPAQPAHS
jgi:Major Facilitator Superfamily